MLQELGALTVTTMLFVAATVVVVVPATVVVVEVEVVDEVVLVDAAVVLVVAAVLEVVDVVVEVVDDVVLVDVVVVQSTHTAMVSPFFTLSAFVKPDAKSTPSGLVRNAMPLLLFLMEDVTAVVLVAAMPRICPVLMV